MCADQAHRRRRRPREPARDGTVGVTRHKSVQHTQRDDEPRVAGGPGEQARRAVITGVPESSLLGLKAETLRLQADLATGHKRRRVARAAGALQQRNPGVDKRAAADAAAEAATGTPDALAVRAALVAKAELYDRLEKGQDVPGLARDDVLLCQDQRADDQRHERRELAQNNDDSASGLLDFAAAERRALQQQAVDRQVLHHRLVQEHAAEWMVRPYGDPWERFAVCGQRDEALPSSSSLRE